MYEISTEKSKIQRPINQITPHKKYVGKAKEENISELVKNLRSIKITQENMEILYFYFLNKKSLWRTEKKCEKQENATKNNKELSF